jgi:two-component system, cell cycle sensor histidine kinase and response regulator CckA
VTPSDPPNRFEADLSTQPAESLFHALLESAPDAILLVDAGGTITLGNRRTAELFGYDADELVGQSIELLIPRRLRAAHVAQREGYAANPHTREMGANLELYGARKDGSEFRADISLSPLRVGSDELVITIVRDVTERHAAVLERIELAREQAAHAEAEAATERLEQILGEIDAIVWEADVDRRRFRFVSRRAEARLGYPLDRWLHEDHFWRKVVHPEDREPAETYFREATAGGKDHEFEYRVCTAEGGVVWVRDRVRVIRMPGGDLELAGVMVDVSGRRELEERLLHSQKMEAVGQLAGGVAHDFNNLLVVIRGYTDLLLLQAADQRVIAHLRQISQAADRAAALTAQLLAFGRRTPSVNERVDMNALLRGVEPMLRRLIDEDAVLTLHTDEPLGPARADPRQLEQVLVNLVINARDAMPLGGEIRISTSMTELDGAAAAELGVEPGRYVVTAVSDSGSGMTEETKARIFEPFFTTKEAGKGTGLGLATVYGVVEQAGGKVVVDTQLGIGSTFFVYLPEALVTEVEVAVEDEGGTGILVVEDEDAVRELVRTVLEEVSGYRVYEAANGRQALEFLERNSARIELILTDVVMPDINGPDFVSRLDSLRASKVLFMSGYADGQLVNRGLRDRTVAILQKPFSPEELQSRVAELLAAGDAPSDA